MTLGRVRVITAGPLVAAGLIVSACAEVVATAPEAMLVPVQPRVVIDGLVEVGLRSEDRIVIDEMMFHAPRVTLNAGETMLRDVTASDDRGALLFRYHIASTDGFGDVLGGPRHWDLVDGGDLVFAFRQLQIAEPSKLEELERSTGVELDPLLGHTAVVHGYMLMSTSSSGFGNRCDGDPDGNPAACTSDEHDGDPDGNPADENDGDPDGNPAKSDDDGEQSDGDPDGNPAKLDPRDGDPDGNPAKPGGNSDGDPDGTPAWDENEAVARSEDKSMMSGGMLSRQERVGRERVPFALVLNAPFDLRLPLGALPPLGADEVLPIELHVALDELFSSERLETLTHAASTARTTVVLELNDASAIGVHVHANGVRRAAESAQSNGIRISGR